MHAFVGQLFVPVASRLFPQPSLCLKPSPEQTVEGEGVQLGVHCGVQLPVVFVPVASRLFPQPSLCLKPRPKQTVEGEGVQLGVQAGGHWGPQLTLQALPVALPEQACPAYSSVPGVQLRTFLPGALPQVRVPHDALQLQPPHEGGLPVLGFTVGGSGLSGGSSGGSGSPGGSCGGVPPPPQFLVPVAVRVCRSMQPS